MCKDVLAAVEGGGFGGIGGVVERVVRVAGGWPGVGLWVEVVAPKALLRVERGLGGEGGWVRDGGGGWRGKGWEWGVRGLRAACVVGVNVHERGERQGVVVGLRVGGEGVGGDGIGELGGDDGVWREIVRAVCEVCLLFILSPGLCCYAMLTKVDAESGPRSSRLHLSRLSRRWLRSLPRPVFGIRGSRGLLSRSRSRARWLLSRGLGSRLPGTGSG